jgi:hypothetical protein
MRTRLAITAVLALGLMSSSAGAGLAVSGISGDGSAGSEQYPQTTVPGEERPPQVLGEQDTGGGTNPTQPNEQVTVGNDDDLPFTGLASIPLLLAGIGLIGFGIVLRRGARSEPAH